MNKTRVGSSRAVNLYLSIAVAVLAGCGGADGGSQQSSADSSEPISQAPAPDAGAPSAPPPPPPPPPPAPPPPPPAPPPPAQELPAESLTGPVYYFSDCQAGAQPGCVAGNNANAGTSMSAPKQNLAGFNYNALPAGSRLLFAQGGAWSNFSVSLQNNNATPSSPLVFDSYATAWGNTAQPWLRLGSAFYAFQFGNWNDMTVDGGYSIRNLRIDGNGVANSWGFYLRNNVRNVTIESNEITGFALGVHAGNTPNPGVGNSYLTIRNNNIHHNYQMGMLGDAHNLLVEGNTFAYNNSTGPDAGSTLHHAIYLGGHGTNAVIRRNTFTNNSVVNGVCYGGNFTVHGQWDNLVFEGNTITQVASNGGCYGVSINPAYSASYSADTESYHSAEWFRGVEIRGNTIVNVGLCSICMASVPGAIVENNLIVNEQAAYHAAILIPDRNPESNDAADTGATVRNNTIVMTRAASWSEGVGLRAGSGTNLRVVSNLVYYGAGSAASTTCFGHTARANFSAFSNNLCHQAGGNGRWSGSYATLAAAQTAGFDIGGLSANPLFVALPSSSSLNDLLQAGSPAIGTGSLTLNATLDRLGATRTTVNIGAR